MRTDAVSIREFKIGSDLEALHEIDTSFVSDHYYTAIRHEHVLGLERLRYGSPLKKVYAIDLDESAIDRGYVAVAKNRVVGFIGAIYEDWNKRCRIQHYHVDGEFRNVGIGSS